VTEYGRSLPTVRADRGQLETAVMNLVVNARDAIRSHGGSTVRIRAARVSAAEAQALGYPDPGTEQALIEVSDDGAGISPEVMTKIFDPFFTTKPVGEGTGLGLAVVAGIVRDRDGRVTVTHGDTDDAGLGGAVFRVLLPLG
jgi:two-component system cell cycle sensor histidine kinase/response regulator CckA